MSDVGAISRRDKEGLRGRGKIVWSACPECGAERWVPLKTPAVLCRSCGGKRAINRPELRNASHSSDCTCHRCKATRGELTKEANPWWKGGKRVHKSGYIYILIDEDDPMRCMAGREAIVFEHRLVMARHIGRPLTDNETVHHRNGNKTDNRIENLELWIGNHSNGIRLDDYHCPGCQCHKENTSHVNDDYSI